MCLWYKKQSKYSVQIFFFVTLKENICFPSPTPKDRVPKTKSNLLQSPPIYTDSVASSNESFHIFYVHSEYLQTTEINKPPTGVSLLTFTNNLPQCKAVLSLAGPQGVLITSHTHTHTYTRHNE
ncbi:hypothetical protein E3U43_022877 [Larimichthys crocea]|uniref:Uncharacterized protein n=1 Tax=Larimichthys crocea TaxID=215358 RepID=A0ACD3R4Z1_LARCR|nr:hypothetical protein E3U43_022877 [Larimichthys crocea]